MAFLLKTFLYFFAVFLFCFSDPMATCTVFTLDSFKHRRTRYLEVRSRICTMSFMKLALPKQYLPIFSTQFGMRPSLPCKHRMPNERFSL